MRGCAETPPDLGALILSVGPAIFGGTGAAPDLERLNCWSGLGGVALNFERQLFRGGASKFGESERNFASINWLPVVACGLLAFRENRKPASSVARHPRA